MVVADECLFMKLKIGTIGKLRRLEVCQRAMEHLNIIALNAKKKEGRSRDMILRDDAEQEARDGICDACDAPGCNNEDICDGFKDEVAAILKEWIAEYDGATSDCVDCDSIRSCNFKHCKYS